MLKEQLQALWCERDFDSMVIAFGAWCQLAKKTRILSLLALILIVSLPD